MYCNLLPPPGADNAARRVRFWRHLLGVHVAGEAPLRRVCHLHVRRAHEPRHRPRGERRREDSAAVEDDADALGVEHCRLSGRGMRDVQ